MPESVLNIHGLDVRYGKLPALHGLDLTMQRGEAIGLLGANGAGKTTLLNTLSGFLRPSAGAIEMFGKPLGHLAPHAIVRAGLLHISQERDLFGDLTVLDNLRLGSLARAADRFEQNVERVYGYFPRLKERTRQRAATMSGGEQQMLAIGRALMAEPKILLFDEPSAGLSPLFVGEIGAMMCALREAGDLSILLVEQNMRLAAQVVNRFYILRAGTLVAQGPVSELEKDHEHLAREFYL
jgi:branched-chain amino acid transport system ATP-binding protein